MVTHCIALRARANVILKSTLNLAILNHAFRFPSITFQSDVGSRSYVLATATNIVTSFPSTASPFFFFSFSPNRMYQWRIRCHLAPTKWLLWERSLVLTHRKRRESPLLFCKVTEAKWLPIDESCKRPRDSVLRCFFPRPLVIPFILQPVYPFTGKGSPAAITAKCTAVVKDSSGNLVGYFSRVVLPPSLSLFARWTLPADIPKCFTILDLVVFRDSGS